MPQPHDKAKACRHEQKTREMGFGHTEGRSGTKNKKGGSWTDLKSKRRYSAASSSWSLTLP
eukprot:5901745-Pleurochrysis_carterae.AAC.1